LKYIDGITGIRHTEDLYGLIDDVLSARAAESVERA
jgi:hypothetical protein